MALALKRSIKDVSLNPPQLGSGLVVAAGGCGHAAKGCDEIGRVAMVLALEERWVGTGIPGIQRVIIIIVHKRSDL